MQIDFHFEHRLRQAKNYESQSKYLQSFQILQQLNEDYPENLDVLNSLLLTYQKLNNIDSSIKFINTYIDEYSDNIEIIVECGKFLFENERWTETIEVLSRHQSDDNLVAFHIGYSYYKLKDYPLAKYYLEKFCKVNQDILTSNQIRLFLGDIYYELGEYDEALDILKKAKLIFQEFWDFSFLNAKIYFAINSYSHAATHIQKALKLNDKNKDLYEWAGKIYFSCNDYKKAEEYFTTFLDLSGEYSVDNLYFLSEILRKNGKTKEALQYLERVLEIDPLNQSAIIKQRQLTS